MPLCPMPLCPLPGSSTSGGVATAPQPLTEPALSPATMYFCAISANAITGNVRMIEAAPACCSMGRF